MVQRWWAALPFAAFAGPIVLLTYARLLGRISWMLGELRPVKRQAKVEAAPVPGVEIRASDPWAVPARKHKKKKKSAEKATPAVASEEAYGFADEPASPPKQTDIPLDGYPPVGAETFAVQAPPETPKEEGADLIGRSISLGEKEEEILATPSKPTPPPARPLIDGVYSFPWYASNRRVLVFLALGLFCMGALALLMEPPV
jgi:hypothetical protein